MKKIISILLLLSMIITLASCGESSNDNKNQETNSFETYEQTLSRQTDTITEAKKIITTTTKSPIVKSNWKNDYYVDDFGDKTNDSYVIGTFYGSFSNSATSGSDLTVFIYLDNKDVTIRLIEYGTHKATFSSYDNIRMKIKTSSGATEEYSPMEDSGDLFLLFGGEGLYNKIIKNDQLSFVITADSTYKSVPDKYIFKTNNIGLAELIK